MDISNIVDEFYPDIFDEVWVQYNCWDYRRYLVDEEQYNTLCAQWSRVQVGTRVKIKTFTGLFIMLPKDIVGRVVAYQKFVDCPANSDYGHSIKLEMERAGMEVLEPDAQERLKYCVDPFLVLDDGWIIHITDVRRLMIVK